jgi:hypothetical protein
MPPTTGAVFILVAYFCTIIFANTNCDNEVFELVLTLDLMTFDLRLFVFHYY